MAVTENKREEVGHPDGDQTGDACAASIRSSALLFPQPQTKVHHMKIKPRNEHVVVRRIPSRAKSSGIIVPGQETERDLFAVTAVGPGGFTPAGTRAPIELDVGQPIVPGMLVFVRPGDYEQFDSDPNSPSEESLRMVIPQSAIIGVEVDENDEPRMMPETAPPMIATFN